MQTLHKHIATGFIVTFAVTLVVFTFVMCIGIVFKVTELLARGVDWAPILRILLSGIPQALSLSIPISALTTSLLVFGRLSADGEITAMKACGISLWQVVSVPLLLAAVLTIVCLHINNELVPQSHYTRRREVSRLGVETPLALLEEGRFIEDFPDMTIYVGRKKGDVLYDIRIYDLRKAGIRREIRAKSGRIRETEGGLDLLMDLQDVRVDPFLDDRPGALTCSRWPFRIKNAFSTSEYQKQEDDWTFVELVMRMRDPESWFPHLNAEDSSRQRMSLAVALHKRLVLSFSCLAFVMLGIPFGIKAHRKESSVGVAISLFLVFNFYLFIIVAESLAKRPEVHPDIIAWMPVVISMVLGTVMLNRGN